MISKNPFSKIFGIIFLVLIVWILHILFLPHFVHWSMQVDDWRWLLYFDTHKGYELGNFSTMRNDLGSVHALQQVYYIGIMKAMLGINQIADQLISLLFKSLAALSAAFLVLKLTKDKLFAVLTVFFYIIFPSTAGLFFIVTGLNHLVVTFACFSIYFYIQSVKTPKKILLASLFFLLALCAGPARAYLLLPIPLITELIRLRKEFKPLVFLRRLLIFYLLPFIILGGGGADSQLRLVEAFPIRISQLFSGNLYTLTLPFQMISTLFIDQHIVLDILKLGIKVFPAIDTDINGFLIFNLILALISIFLGYVFKRDKIRLFTFKLIISTLILETIFYVLGILSRKGDVIPFLDFQGNLMMNETINPTVFQATLGSYFFVLGLILGLEWWKNVRDNKLLMVITFAWLWLTLSVVGLYFTRPWWMNMIFWSNDRYMFISSLGAVVFTAGIVALSFKALLKIQKLPIKLFSTFFLIFIIVLITWNNYVVLGKLDTEFIQTDGGVNSYWEETMYKHFLNKFGADNLRKPILLYIDYLDDKFNVDSFVRFIPYRIYYDSRNNLIRDYCKAVIIDIKVLEKEYTIRNGEKGFMHDYSICIDPIVSSKGGYNIFYPLSNFYAYKIVDKEFVDIKDEILRKLEETK